MGTQIATTFGSLPGTAAAVAARTHEFLENAYGATLGSYFADVVYDIDRGSYDVRNDTYDLRDAEDTRERLLSRGGGSFEYEAFVGFATVDLHIMLYADVEGAAPGTTTMAVTFNKELSSYLFTSDVPHAPFAALLVKMAAAVEAPCFVTEAEPMCLRFLRLSDLVKPGLFEPPPLVLGWKDGAVATKDVLSSFDFDSSWVERTLSGYCYVSRLGR
jgi:hypothetical protein